MKTIKFAVILILIFLLKTEFLLGDTKNNPWIQFTSYPNKSNYELCTKMINDSLYGPYKTNDYGERINTPTHHNLIDKRDIYKRFLKQVREINPYAVELAIQLFPLTDGAASEELFGEVGMIVTVKPEFFLSMIEKYKIKDKGTIENMVASLPIDEFVDDLDKRIKEINERIIALKKVEKISLIRLRDQCIDILSDYLNKLREIEMEEGS